MNNKHKKYTKIVKKNRKNIASLTLNILSLPFTR